MAASKKNQAHLKRARQRIEAAKGFRRKEQYDELWKRLNDLYRGKHFPPDASDEDLIAINMCFATINVIGPSVAVNYPKITVNARSFDKMDEATIAEAVVNYWFKHYEVLPEFQLAVKDFLIFGFGWLKTGYRFVEEEVEDGEATQAEIEARILELDRFAVENPHLAADLPDDEQVAAEIDVITRKVVVHDAPFVERISPWDVYVDPEATTLRNARWIAHRVTKSMEEVKANKDYKASARKSVKPDRNVDDEWFMGSDTRSSVDDDADLKRVTVWEYYDLEDGTMCVFSEIGDEHLIEPTPQPYAFGHPFLMMRNYEVPDQFYPMGELEALEPIQQELNLTRSAMFNDRKAYRRKWLYKPEMFDKDGRAALESSQDNVFVPVANNSVPLNEVVAQMPAPAPNPQLYQDSDVITNDLNVISGVTEYMRGNPSEIRRTATEVNTVQDAANARAADKLARVEWAVSAIGQRLVMLAQQFMDGEKTARITGQDGMPLWFNYTADDIMGEFDFDVVGGSTQPLNEAQRRQDAMDLLQVLSPFMDPMAGMVNVPEVIRHVLEQFGVKNAERFLGQGPQMPPGMPPGMAPPGGEMPPGEMPPGAQGPGGPPAEMPAGPPPPMALPPAGGGGPQMPAALPPELLQMLAQMPPEILQELLAQAGPPPEQLTPMGNPIPQGAGQLRVG